MRQNYKYEKRQKELEKKRKKEEKKKRKLEEKQAGTEPAAETIAPATQDDNTGV